MSSSSSSSHGRAIVPWDTGGPLSQPQFPAGLRVLVVDDDVVCLRVIGQMLKICHYQVTTCNRAVIALEILRERNWEFDLILSDLHMPDMDGFKLLEHVGLEMDLPVIMMSADEGKDVVMKGVKHGACDYLLKPVSMEALKNIWQHVVRKKRNNELKELENSGSVEDGDKQKKRFEETDYTSSNEGNLKNLKKRKDEKEEEVEERDDSSATKKQRVVWSMELHNQFLDAVKKLGVEKAVPKKILEMMNIPGLTRENVASHLQKYRLYLRRVHSQQNPNRVDTHFSGTSEAYSPMSSLDQYSLQFLAASGRIPPQSVLPVPSGSSIVTNTGMNMPISGQKPFFDPDVHSSKLRSSVGQPVTNRQMSLNGLQTYIEPGQFGMEQRQFGETQGFLPSALNASSSFSHGAINGHLNNSSVMQIPQQGQHISLSHQQSRGYLVNANVREHDSGEQMLSSEILTQILGRNGTAVGGESSPEDRYMNNAYGTSQAFYAANYQNNCVNGSIGNSHPFASSNGASNIKSTSMIQAVTSATESSKDASSMKLLKPVYTNYDIVGDLHQSQDWKLQNVNLSYGSAQLLGPKQNHVILKDGTGRNTCTFRKEVFSITAEIEPQKVACVPQHNGALRVENPCRLKEVVPESSYQNEFDNLPDDLMDAVRFQQQEGFGQDEQPYMVDIFGA